MKFSEIEVPLITATVHHRIVTLLHLTIPQARKAVEDLTDITGKHGKIFTQQLELKQEQNHPFDERILWTNPQATLRREEE